MKKAQTTLVEISVLPDEKILSELKDISIEKLKLDPNNVRFRHLSNKSDDEIEEEIWNEADTRNLYGEIFASRGLTNAPVVDHDLIVKEGNRRLVCLRRLSEAAHAGLLKDIPTDQFDVIQCFVLPKDTSPKALAIYLAREHVSGKKEWRALNQAAYLNELYTKFKFSYDDLKNLLSMGKSTVIRKITAFRATVDYGDDYGKSDDGWINKYSYFDEAYKPRLKNWMMEESHLEDFKHWVAEKRLPTGMSVRKLHEIIENDAVYAEFEKGSPETALKRAMSMLSKEDPAKTSTVFKAIKVAIDRLGSMPRNEFNEIIRDSKRLSMLQELENTLRAVIKDVEALKSKRS